MTNRRTGSGVLSLPSRPWLIQESDDWSADALIRALLSRLWDRRHRVVNSLSPRRRSGERGNPINTALLSPALSSLRGGEGEARHPLTSSLFRRFISKTQPCIKNACL